MSILLFQIRVLYFLTSPTRLVGGQYGRPFDSTQGTPSWFIYPALAVIAFIIIGIYWRIQKDKKSPPTNGKKKKPQGIFYYDPPYGKNFKRNLPTEVKKQQK